MILLKSKLVSITCALAMSSMVTGDIVIADARLYVLSLILSPLSMEVLLAKLNITLFLGLETCGRKYYAQKEMLTKSGSNCCASRMNGLSVAFIDFLSMTRRLTLPTWKLSCIEGNLRRSLW